MKIIVCMKQVPDPQASSTGTTVDSETKKVIMPQGTPPVLNPYDENALEVALKIKDAGDAHVTVISAGRNLAKPVLRKSLAVGADELILLQDAQFENPGSYATAHILAAAIREIGKYDLILCGRQAADTDAGQVGSGIAQILNLPCVTAACELELADGSALVGRVVSDGIEEVTVPLPVVITASSELGEMRYPGVKELMAAQKTPITTKSAQDLGVDVSQLKGVNLVSLASPPGRTSQCQYVEAETPEEAGALLAEKVREAQLL